MKPFRTVLMFLILLILAVVLFQNQEALGTPLTFSFLKWTFSLTLGFWILFTFVAVAALFVLVGAWKGMRMGFEIRKRDQAIARLEHELAALHKGRPPHGDKPLE